MATAHVKDKTAMVKPLMDAYFQYWKMALDTTTVLNYRLPLLNTMASEPAAAMNPLNWLEVNRMIGEKMMAFGQANMLLALSAAQLPYGKPLSVEKTLQIQRKALRPVVSTLSQNARRVRKKA